MMVCIQKHFFRHFGKKSQVKVKAKSKSHQVLKIEFPVTAASAKSLELGLAHFQRKIPTPFSFTVSPVDVIFAKV